MNKIYCYELQTGNGSVFFRNEKERQDFLQTFYAGFKPHCLKPYECSKQDRTWWFKEIEYKNGKYTKHKVFWEYVKN